MKDEKKKTEKKNQEKTKKLIITVLFLVLALAIVILLAMNLMKKPVEKEVSKPLEMDETQDVYVKPESPIDRSKVVTMPGWGSFTIPANTTNITKGFEFHNPEENVWYEILVSYNGEALENIVVDSGTKVKVNHYLGLAGLKENASDVKCDKNIFTLEKDEDGDLAIYANDKFDSDTTMTVVCDDGKEYTFDLTCGYNCYYMTFSLYLGTPEDKDNSDLLYESGLVSPGMYIQTMTINKALSEGTYKAYVFIQPYRSDKITKTNSGTIVLELNAK